MKLEAGKFYMMRNGAIAGPLYEDEGEWECTNFVEGLAPMWHLETGVCLFFSFGPESDNPEFDLVEEA
tara:strand:- start:216 stop:419 length:204 start_codon:yes stop_codon:yes gene_type:complete